MNTTTQANPPTKESDLDLEKVFAAIDHANAQDPNKDTDSSGETFAKELLYSMRMSHTLANFAPSHSAHLAIAARAQHIERWKSLRSDYPEGRAGYKKWRAELGLFHAKTAGNIMQTLGYADSDIDKVKYLVQKRGLKTHSETQTLEDVICLVFLEFYFNAFAQKHSEEKIISIVQKTWKKMSEAGHSAALKIDYPSHLLNLIHKALG